MKITRRNLNALIESYLLLEEEEGEKKCSRNVQI